MYHTDENQNTWRDTLKDSGKGAEAERGYMASGARRKSGVPMLEHEVFRKKMYDVLKNYLWHFGYFSAASTVNRRPHNDSAPGNCAPIAPSLCPCKGYESIRWAQLNFALFATCLKHLRKLCRKYLSVEHLLCLGMERNFKYSICYPPAGLSVWYQCVSITVGSLFLSCRYLTL